MNRKLTPIIAPIVIVLLVACGGGDRKGATTTARAGLSTALAATNAARDAFTTWSKAHEMSIVARATSLEQGDRELAAYRAHSQPVLGSLVVAYTSIAAASAALTLAEAQPAELATAVRLATDALRAAVAVRDAVLALRAGGP